MIQCHSWKILQCLTTWSSDQVTLKPKFEFYCRGIASYPIIHHCLIHLALFLCQQPSIEGQVYIVSEAHFCYVLLQLAKYHLYNHHGAPSMYIILFCHLKMAPALYWKTFLHHLGTSAAWHQKKPPPQMPCDCMPSRTCARCATPKQTSIHPHSCTFSIDLTQLQPLITVFHCDSKKLKKNKPQALVEYHSISASTYKHILNIILALLAMTQKINISSHCTLWCITLPSHLQWIQ